MQLRVTQDNGRKERTMHDKVSKNKNPANLDSDTSTKVKTCKKDVTKKDRINKDAEHAKDIAEDTYIDRAPFI